jgi:hypothetical protein
MTRIRAVRGGHMRGDTEAREQLLVDMNEGLAPFYRIVRETEASELRREVRFVVLDTADADEEEPTPVTTVAVRHHRHEDAWFIHPGSQMSHMLAIEALARSYALTLASYECSAITLSETRGSL